MSHRIRSAASALLALALLTVLPAARAAAGSDTAYQWQACNDGEAATGSLATLTITPSTGDHSLVTGTIEPCHSIQQLDSFALAQYDGRRYGAGMMVPYGRLPGDHGAFSLAMNVAPTTVAICIITSWNTRLTCASVTPSARTGVEQPAVPLSTDDPAVRFAALTSMQGPELVYGEPGCPTCWS